MYFNRRIDEVMAEFGTGPDGLTEAQVAENLEKYGPNKLYEKKKKSVFAVFLSQFKDLLVIILIIAAMISMATGNVESTVVILAVLILNAILGTVQYLKAEKSLDSLKSLSSPTAKVIRNGEHMEIKAEDLAAGDIIRLEAGDIVPGDARVIDSYSLKVNESSLTGESEGVEKFSDAIEGEKVALGDQKNMVFSGSLVTYGRGLAVVTGVGVHTELGKIADLMNNTAERKTPLQVTMDGFSKKLSMAIIIICIGVFGLSVYRDMEITDALLFAVALAVAAIPEALSSIITISLAIGTSRMADQNAIIKQLNAVEGLGCVSVICSDKTGTLTQNKMTVEQLYYDDDLIDPLLQASILCNDTVIADGVTKGDPTETAFVDYYMSKKDDYDQVKAKYPRLSELPFDSDRKLMSTLHDIDGTVTMYTKGALDVILDRVSGLSEERKEEIRQYNFDLSDQGLRVLAFARRIFDEPRDLDFDDEKDFQFLGLIAEMDPPRPESAQAVADCIAAGIKPIMITGDHKITASAIARRIGILQDGDIAVTGTELDDMDDATLREKLPHISVYARVSPDNKIRIVQAWQDMGNIVAMTGDGVNDAPALKSADVGVAMGITGTEVAKDAASMILTDTVLYASLLALPTPFTAVQLLFINLITDSLPALAISMEPTNPNLLSEKPRPRNESVLTRPTLVQIGLQGLVIGIATIAAFIIGLESDPTTASTMAFATLCLARLWHGFNSRGKESIFKLGLLTNVYTIGAFVLGAILLFCILLVPFAAGAFGIAALTASQIGWILALALAPTVVIQIVKIIKY